MLNLDIMIMPPVNPPGDDSVPLPEEDEDE